MPDFMSEQLKIGICSGKIFLDLDGSVHASMKKTTTTHTLPFLLLTCCPASAIAKVGLCKDTIDMLAYIPLPKRINSHFFCAMAWHIIF